MRIRNVVSKCLTCLASVLVLSCAEDVRKAQPDNGAVPVAKLFSTTLSNMDVNSISQDEDGYIWIGTFRGLNRYDSHSYKQFFRGEGEGELSSNQIYALQPASDGGMWIAAGFAYHYDSQTDSFHKIPQPENTTIRNVYRGGSEVFFSDRIDIFRYDSESDTLLLAFPRNEDQAYAQYFIGQEDDLWRLKSGVLTRSLLSSEEIAEYALPFTPSFAAETRAGDIWMSDGRQMAIFNTLLRRVIDVPAPVVACKQLYSSSIKMVSALPEDRLLFQTSENEFFIYDNTEETVVSASDPSFPIELPSFSSVAGLFVDRDQNLWFFSDDHGVSVSNTRKGLFSVDDTALKGLADKTVASIAYSEKFNTLYIALNQGGVYMYNRDDDHLTSLPWLEARQLLVDREDGILWVISGVDGELQQWKIGNNSLTLQHGYSAYMPLSIAQDAQGTIWLGCPYRYIQYLERGSNELKMLPTSTETSQFFFTPTLLPMADGRLMVAASAHYPIFIDQNLKFDSASLTDSDYSSAINFFAFVPTDSFQDEDGIIWLGTVGSGLLRIDVRNGDVMPVDGEPCDDISGILRDNDGNIWVSTMNGIGKLDRASMKFVNYQIEDGIGGNQFVDRAACALPDGTLVFGGNHGVTLVNPQRRNSEQKIPVLLDGLKINNDIVHRELSPKKGLVLTHKDKTITIRYTALSYNHMEQVRYRYILDGFDPEWVSAGMNMEAYYSNLPAGKYVFRVIASTPSGSLSSDEMSLPVVVKPAPWCSWWAILLYVLVSIVTVYFFYKYYKKLAEIRATAERAEREEQFFTNIAHEFRSPLTMISGPLSMLESRDDLNGEGRRLVEVAQKSSRWMLQLVDQFLDVEMIKNDKLKLSVQKSDISVILRNLAEVYANAGAIKGVSFVTEGLDMPFEMPLDVDKVSKIVTNLLSNAMKFTPAGGTVRLRFDTTSDGYAEVTVTDTGVGVPDEVKERIFERYFQVEKDADRTIGSGIGLYYSHNLAEVHHGKLWVEDNPAGQGSRFVLHLPYGQEVYKEEEWNKGTAVIIPSAVQHVEPVSAPAGEISDKPKILAVDDDMDVAHYLQMLLSGSYDVTCCYDAASALKYLSDGNVPDLVISDVMMPVKDGYELCREIRADVQTSHLPVVLVTAKTSVEDKIRGLEDGADAFVTKPFEPKYLLAVIKTLLEARHSVQKTISESTSVEAIGDEVIPPQDKAFLERLFAIIEESLSDSDLDVDVLAEKMGISRTKFYYKVKGLTGESPAVLLKNTRLNKSVVLIREGKYNLSEIADKVGFASLSQFSVSFKKQFGVTPRDFK